MCLGVGVIGVIYGQERSQAMGIFISVRHLLPCQMWGLLQAFRPFFLGPTLAPLAGGKDDSYV